MSTRRSRGIERLRFTIRGCPVARFYDFSIHRFVRAPLYYYCFVKGFRTGKGPLWQESSVDVWLEFVVRGYDLDDVPDDVDIISTIERFLAGHPTHSWILNLTQIKHEWGVEKEVTTDVVTWPFGTVSAWRMPDYAEQLIDAEVIDVAT